jgi:hypothetical protein
MTAPGFSVTELFQAIKKCKDIWDAFTDEFGNAPARVQELVTTCKYLYDVLLDIKSVISDSYSQEAGFLRTLQETDRFIVKYKHLKQEYLDSEGSSSFNQRLRDKWLRIWETTKHEFDDKARYLRDALSLEIQKLVLFLVLYALSVAPGSWIGGSFKD